MKHLVTWTGLIGEGENGRRYEIMRTSKSGDNLSRQAKPYLLVLPSTIKNYPSDSISDCRLTAEYFESEMRRIDGE